MSWLAIIGIAIGGFVIGAAVAAIALVLWIAFSWPHT